MRTLVILQIFNSSQREEVGSRRLCLARSRFAPTDGKSQHEVIAGCYSTIRSLDQGPRKVILLDVSRILVFILFVGIHVCDIIYLLGSFV